MAQTISNPTTNGSYKLHKNQIRMTLHRKCEHYSGHLLQKRFYPFLAKIPVIVVNTEFRAASPAVKSDRTAKVSVHNQQVSIKLNSQKRKVLVHK